MLPGMEEEPQLEQIRAPMVAFGKFVKPEMYDVFGEYDLGDVTDAEKAWMTPQNLAEALFSPPKDGDMVVDRQLALNPYEYKIVLRSPTSLGETALSTALGANDLDDERVATGKRARIHALEAKQDVMSGHLSKLKERRQDVKELKREARAPGYAHKSAERMKELTSVVWLELRTILDVVHVQRGWDDATRKRAEAAMINHLTQGSQRYRVKNWQSMIDLTDSYLGARIHIFRDRIKKAQDLIDEHIEEQA